MWQKQLHSVDHHSWQNSQNCQEAKLSHQHWNPCAIWCFHCDPSSSTSLSNWAWEAFFTAAHSPVIWKCDSKTCHLDPHSFFQVYNYYILLLSVKFNLSYCEIVSLQSTFDAMAKTHYYFGAVAEFIINAEKNWISSIIDHHRGFRIGFLFLSVMKEIQSSLTNQPPVWFNDYKFFECQNYNKWKLQWRKKVW